MAARRRTGADRKRPTGKTHQDTQHVFVSGASGIGRTTILVRLVDGALAAGCAVVVIDAKEIGHGSGGVSS
jgi:nucleoside-triphosphatase THEP1